GGAQRRRAELSQGILRDRYASTSAQAAEPPAKRPVSFAARSDDHQLDWRRVSRSCAPRGVGAEDRYGPEQHSSRPGKRKLGRTDLGSNRISGKEAPQRNAG